MSTTRKSIAGTRSMPSTVTGYMRARERFTQSHLNGKPAHTHDLIAAMGAADICRRVHGDIAAVRLPNGIARDALAAVGAHGKVPRRRMQNGCEFRWSSQRFVECL
jgi:hypothetical protein